MIFFTLSLAVLWSGCSCGGVNKFADAPPPYVTYSALQELDHFNYASSFIWKEKYLYSDVYWKGEGPLFFYAGNEAPIEDFYQNSGYIFTLAKEFNAMIMFAEHRFYGKSLPFGEDSFSANNLGYLSVEQALADYAVLVQGYRDKYAGITKVIAFGGSYGGMLAAWFRFKYPNLVDGALAASAPIFIVSGGLVPRTAFFQKVTEDFAAVDEKCPMYVREGFTLIDELAGQGIDGLLTLSEYFSLCVPLTKEKVSHLKGWVRNSFTYLAMVDYPYPANFLAPLPAYPVTVSCQLIIDAKNRAVGLAHGAGLFYNGTNGNLTCFDIDTEFIECADATGCGTGPAAISWDYQVCTEMNLPSDSNNVTDMFPSMIYAPSAYCKEKYGVQYREGWIKAQYWGKDILTATNIIFSNGALDPWSIGGVGIDTPVSDSIVKIIIEGGAHHLDLRFPNPSDPLSVIDAREKERSTIKKWLNS